MQQKRSKNSRENPETETGKCWIPPNDLLVHFTGSLFCLVQLFHLGAQNPMVDLFSVIGSGSEEPAPSSRGPGLPFRAKGYCDLRSAKG